MGRNVPFEERVRVRAYEIFLERGGTGGSPEEDWLRAEAEVRGQGASPPADGQGNRGAADAGSKSAASPSRPGPEETAPPRKSTRNVKPTTANRRSH